MSETAINQLPKEKLELVANPAVLSIRKPGSRDDSYFFDRAGRLIAAYENHWYILRGLSGRTVAKRWQGSHREVRRVSSQDMRFLLSRARASLQGAFRKGLGSAARHLKDGLQRDELEHWVERVRDYDPKRDIAQFRHVYRPVGILPPDQYLSCVVQITEGCAWNRCSFCTFYHGQSYRIKSLQEIREHVREIKDYLGEGLSLRSSIFLGEASALDTPIGRLGSAMEEIHKSLVSGMPDFRGFFSFLESERSTCRTTSDFVSLRKLGLRRLYYGVETGSVELRHRLGKPGSMQTLSGSIRAAKASGISVGLIFLLGVGGTGSSESHVGDSLRFLESLPLDRSDILYFSPLRRTDGSLVGDASDLLVKKQFGTFRDRWSSVTRVSLYDVREFVY